LVLRRGPRALIWPNPAAVRRIVCRNPNNFAGCSRAVRANACINFTPNTSRFTRGTLFLACGPPMGQLLRFPKPLTSGNSALMRGNTGHWGTPFTKANANEMRLRGLRIRQFHAAEQRKKRIMEKVADDERRQALKDREAESRKPGPKAAGGQTTTAREAMAAITEQCQVQPVTAPKLLRTQMPAQPDGRGYELSPGGEWMECNNPSPKMVAETGTANALGLLRLQWLRAMRMRARRAGVAVS